MYIKMFVILNVILVFTAIFIYTKLLIKNYSSMFDESFFIELYITFIIPLVFIVINLILDIIFKPNIWYWFILPVMIIIPIFRVIHSILKNKKNSKICNEYKSQIIIFMLEISKELDIDINKSNIKVYVDKNEKINTTIIIDKNYVDENKFGILKHSIESELRDKFDDISIYVFFE